MFELRLNIPEIPLGRGSIFPSHADYAAKLMCQLEGLTPITRLGLFGAVILVLLIAALALGSKRRLVFGGLFMAGLSGWLLEDLNRELLMLPAGTVALVFCTIWLSLLAAVQLVIFLGRFMCPFRSGAGLIFSISFLLVLLAALAAALSPEGSFWRDRMLTTAGPLAALFCLICLLASTVRFARSALMLLFWGGLACLLLMPTLRQPQANTDPAAESVVQVTPEISNLFSRSWELLTAQRG